MAHHSRSSFACKHHHFASVPDTHAHSSSCDCECDPVIDLTDADIQMEELNEASARREDLIKRLRGAWKVTTVPAPLHSALYIGDIDMLELEILPHAVDSKTSTVVTVRPTDLAGTTQDMVRIWRQSTQKDIYSAPTTPNRSPAPLSLNSSPRTPVTQQSPDIANPYFIQCPDVAQKFKGRSKSQAEIANARDGGRCVITGATQVQVAHIFPYPLLEASKHDNKRGALFRTLRCYMKPEVIYDVCRALGIYSETVGILEDQHGKDVVQNMITLRNDIHAYWNSGTFAIKPGEVSEDGKSLRCQLFFQMRNSQAMGDMDLLDKPQSSRGANHGWKSTSDVINKPEGRGFYESGDEFIIRTEDPVKWPLPDRNILQVQWLLTRIVGLCGASGELDGYNEEDSLEIYESSED